MPKYCKNQSGQKDCDSSTFGEYEDGKCDTCWTTQRLAYLKQEIKAERISYQEVAELHDLAHHIDPSDTLLLEWANVCELHHKQDHNCN